MYEELIKRLRNHAIRADSGYEIGNSMYLDILKAADALEVKRGKWEQVDDYRYPWGCTNCRKTFSGRYNFCPNCGADMREEQA